MSPLDEARALVGGDGPAAERVAAVVAERDDLRARLAAYESASAEASTETLAALDALDAVAGMECDGPEEALSNQQARAIREHLRWLTTRYQREHVGRERAEMQRDVARTERDVLEMQLAERDAVLERIERALGDACTGDLAGDVERVVRERARYAELWRDEQSNALAARERETAPQEMAHAVGDVWRDRDGRGHEHIVTSLSAYDAGIARLHFGPVTEGPPSMFETLGWRRVRCAAEQPRAELGETDAGEGE
jgi:hypothetical protein